MIYHNVYFLLMLCFFHASSEYDKSYMINRIAYFGLKTNMQIVSVTVPAKHQLKVEF